MLEAEVLDSGKKEAKGSPKSMREFGTLDNLAPYSYSLLYHWTLGPLRKLLRSQLLTFSVATNNPKTVGLKISHRDTLD